MLGRKTVRLSEARSCVRQQGVNLDDTSLEELTVTAALLIAHARRGDAITLVASSIDAFGDRRGLVLLARLNLESGTKEGARAAVHSLELWRCNAPWDLEAIALLRDAFEMLGRTSAASRLDRDVCWTALGGAPFPKRLRGAKEQV